METPTLIPFLLFIPHGLGVLWLTPMIQGILAISFQVLHQIILATLILISPIFGRVFRMFLLFATKQKLWMIQLNPSTFVQKLKIWLTNTHKWSSTFFFFGRVTHHYKQKFKIQLWTLQGTTSVANQYFKIQTFSFNKYPLKTYLLLSTMGFSLLQDSKRKRQPKYTAKLFVPEMISNHRRWKWHLFIPSDGGSLLSTFHFPFLTTKNKQINLYYLCLTSNPILTIIPL